MCSDARQCVIGPSLGLSTRTTYSFCPLLIFYSSSSSCSSTPCSCPRLPSLYVLHAAMPASFPSLPSTLSPVVRCPATSIPLESESGVMEAVFGEPNVFLPPTLSPSRCSATSMDAGDTPRGRWGSCLDLRLLLLLLLFLLLLHPLD